MFWKNLRCDKKGYYLPKNIFSDDGIIDQPGQIFGKESWDEFPE
jgi:hypothetical protein